MAATQAQTDCQPQHINSANNLPDKDHNSPVFANGNDDSSVGSCSNDGFPAGKPPITSPGSVPPSNMHAMGNNVRSSSHVPGVGSAACYPGAVPPMQQPPYPLHQQYLPQHHMMPPAGYAAAMGQFPPPPSARGGPRPPAPHLAATPGYYHNSPYLPPGTAIPHEYTAHPHHPHAHHHLPHHLPHHQQQVHATSSATWQPPVPAGDTAATAGSASGTGTGGEGGQVVPPQQQQQMSATASGISSQEVTSGESPAGGGGDSTQSPSGSGGATNGGVSRAPGVGGGAPVSPCDSTGSQPMSPAVTVPPPSQSSLPVMSPRPATSHSEAVVSASVVAAASSFQPPQQQQPHQQPPQTCSPGSNQQAAGGIAPGKPAIPSYTPLSHVHPAALYPPQPQPPRMSPAGPHYPPYHPHAGVPPAPPTAAVAGVGPYHQQWPAPHHHGHHHPAAHHQMMAAGKQASVMYGAGNTVAAAGRTPPRHPHLPPHHPPHLPPQQQLKQQHMAGYSVVAAAAAGGGCSNGSLPVMPPPSSTPQPPCRPASQGSDIAPSQALQQQTDIPPAVSSNMPVIGPDGVPLDDVSQHSTLSNTSVASADDRSRSPKPRKDGASLSATAVPGGMVLSPGGAAGSGAGGFSAVAGGTGTGAGSPLHHPHHAHHLAQQHQQQQQQQPSYHHQQQQQQSQHFHQALQEETSCDRVSNMSSPTGSVSTPSSNWPRSPVSVYNHMPVRDSYQRPKADSLNRLYEMDDNPLRRDWLNRLLSLMEERGSPILQCPTVSKQPLDLFRLYHFTKERGGFVEVSKAKVWKDVALALGIGGSSSAAYTLRKHYMKHLIYYECHFDRGGCDPAPILAKFETRTSAAQKKKNARNSPGPQDTYSNSGSMDGFPAGYPSYSAVSGGACGGGVTELSSNGPSQSPTALQQTSSQQQQQQQQQAPSQGYGYPPSAGYMQHYAGTPGGALSHHAPHPTEYGVAAAASASGVSSAVGGGGGGATGPTAQPSTAGGAPGPGAAAVPPQSHYMHQYQQTRGYHHPHHHHMQQMHHHQQQQQQQQQHVSGGEYCYPGAAPAPSSGYAPAGTAAASSVASSAAAGAVRTGPYSGGGSAGGHQTAPPSTPPPVSPSPLTPHTANTTTPPPPSQQSDGGGGSVALCQQAEGSVSPATPGPTVTPPYQASSAVVDFSSQLAKQLSAPLSSRAAMQQVSPSKNAPQQQQQQQPSPPVSTPSSVSSSVVAASCQQTVAVSSASTPSSGNSSYLPAPTLARQLAAPSQTQLRHSSASAGGAAYPGSPASAVSAMSGGAANCAPYRSAAGACVRRSLDPAGTAAASHQNPGGYTQQQPPYGWRSSSGYPAHQSGSPWQQRGYPASSAAGAYPPSSPAAGSVQHRAGMAGPMSGGMMRHHTTNSASVGKDKMAPTVGTKSASPAGVFAGPGGSAMVRSPAAAAAASVPAFPADSVEATTPVLNKRRRYQRCDVAPLDGWRLVLALRSGQLAEGAAAIEQLLVLSRDDSTVAWLTLAHMPGMLTALLQHFRLCVAAVMAETTAAGVTQQAHDTSHTATTDALLSTSTDADTPDCAAVAAAANQDDTLDLGVCGAVDSSDRETVLSEAAKVGQNYTMISRQQRPVTLADCTDTILVCDSQRAWQRHDTSDTQWSHVATHARLECSRLPLVGRQDHDQDDSRSFAACVEKTDGAAGTSTTARDSEAGKLAGFSSDVGFFLSRLRPDIPPTAAASADGDAAPRPRRRTASNNNKNDINAEDSSSRRTGKCAGIVEKREEEEKSANNLVNGRVIKLERADDETEQEVPGAKLRVQYVSGKRRRRHSTAWSSSSCDDYEPECCEREQSSLCSSSDTHDGLIARCVALSTLLRNLSFVPGNEAELAACEPLLLLLTELIQLQHRHPPRAARHSNYDRDEEPPDFCQSASPEGTTVSGGGDGAAECWWSQHVPLLHENSLVTVCNIASHLRLVDYEEGVVLPLLDTLLHWLVCRSSYAADPLSSCDHNPSSLVSPQRLALETVCRLVVNADNLDLLLATPPISRLRRLCSLAADWVSHCGAGAEDQVRREITLSLLYYLSGADERVAQWLAEETGFVVALIRFIETAEQNALSVASSQGVNSLRDNPELMGTSLDLLARAAQMLLQLARCRQDGAPPPALLACENSLLQLVMSQILDQRVAVTLSHVLYQITSGGGGGVATSSSHHHSSSSCSSWQRHGLRT